MNKELLLMYSGGYDSILSACILAENGYNVHLVHFKTIGYLDNRISIEEGVKLIFKDYYLREKISFLGDFDIRRFHYGIKLDLMDTWNKKIKDMAVDYPNLVYCDLNCLICRSGMYNAAIELANYYGFEYIAEGSRKCQKFSIEQPKMIERYSSICQERGLTLLTPILDLEDEVNKLSQLYKRNITLRCEGKCLLGYPIEDVNKDRVDDAIKFFDNKIMPILEENFMEEFAGKSLKLKK